MAALPLPFLIGRSGECHLRPTSDTINLHHCVIEDRQGRPVIRDLASASGTFVNNMRLTTDYPLFDGDELRVGPLRFRVSVDYPIQAVEEPDDDDVLSKLVARSDEVTSTEPVSDALTQGGTPRPTNPPTKVFERLTHETSAATT
jgi:pSer/pThr/pTyr-binding forkhead associated (FHA) protein